VKGENPLFDRIVDMSSEQGLYTYWRRRFWHGKFVARFVAASILEYYQGFTGSFRILLFIFGISLGFAILVLSIEITFLLVKQLRKLIDYWRFLFFVWKKGEITSKVMIRIRIII